MENKGKVWKIVAICGAVLALCAIIIGVIFAVSKRPQNKPQQPAITTSSVQETEDVIPGVTGEVIEEPKDELSCWNDLEAKKALIEYVENVTAPNSEDFIPFENRVAVFDMDGTLVCETDPYYFDHLLLVHRVLEDPDYKDKASDFEKDVATRLQAKFNGEDVEVSMTEHGQAVASAFKGMTLDEFEEYVEDFRNQPAPGYEGMTRGQSFYLPMIQVVNYLQQNGFEVYIVSGTDRFIMRGLCEGMIEVPRDHLIGSDMSLVAEEQGDTDGLEYTFDDDDKLVLGGDFIIKDLNMNKVTVIAQEIGVQPVLSFGNSSGDAAMAEYATSNNPYKSLAFMICCDDTTRENGNVEKAEKMKAMCEEFGWIPVSMKDDWGTIYGEGVEKK